MGAAIAVGQGDIRQDIADIGAEGALGGAGRGGFLASPRRGATPSGRATPAGVAARVHSTLLVAATAGAEAGAILADLKGTACLRDPGALAAIACVLKGTRITI